MRADLQDVVDTVSRLLDAPATLEDRDFNLVVYSAQTEEVDHVRQQSILQRSCLASARDWFKQFGITTSEGPVSTPADPEQGITARRCLPARSGGVTYGYLWVLDDNAADASPDGDDPRLSEAMHQASRAGHVLAQQARTRGHLDSTLDALLSGQDDAATAAAGELVETGRLRPRQPLAVVILASLDRDHSSAPLNLWRLPSRVLGTSDEAGATLVVPLEDPGNHGEATEIARQAIAATLDQVPAEQRHGYAAGVSEPCTNPIRARRALTQARQALRIAHAIPERRPVATWAELGVYRLTNVGSTEALADALLPQTVLDLQRTSPELAETALVYLENAGNVQRTAAALSLHRQSLYYRLSRIERAIGESLDNGDARLRLHLALRMAPLLGE